MFSMTKIENLKWQIGEDINFLSFGKFVTLLAQKLKNLQVQVLTTNQFVYIIS